VAAHFEKRETINFVLGMLGTLDCRWLPAHPFFVSRADCKIEQLYRAERLGFRVPQTLITNEPEEFVDFFNRQHGPLVSKPAIVNVFSEVYPLLARYTERVTRQDLLYLDRLETCPAIFQQCITKDVEVRVTVVGERVFAAEIQSQRSRHARIDWRRYDLSHTPHLPHELPSAVAVRCCALLHELNLSYGAIDLIRDADGEYVFLEVNPNGQYLWLEHLTGMPISDAVCDFLAGTGEEVLARSLEPPLREVVQW
jgi:glutathione synthase/RimK-type ligase-like ATP-grasp enzyme